MELFEQCLWLAWLGALLVFTFAGGALFGIFRERTGWRLWLSAVARRCERTGERERAECYLWAAGTNPDIRHCEGYRNTEDEPKRLP